MSDLRTPQAICIPIVSKCSFLYLKKRLPSGELLAALHINDKLLERHRAYIIAGVLISRGGYEVLRDYLYGSEE